MIRPDHPTLSIVRQCRLVSISRSSFYHVSRGETAWNLALMGEIDRQFLETPFYGAQQMTWHLRAEGASGQHQAGSPADAVDGSDADLPAAPDQHSRQGAQDLPVSAAGRQY